MLASFPGGVGSRQLQDLFSIAHLAGGGAPVTQQRSPPGINRRNPRNRKDPYRRRVFRARLGPNHGRTTVQIRHLVGGFRGFGSFRQVFLTWQVTISPVNETRLLKLGTPNRLHQARHPHRRRRRPLWESRLPKASKPAMPLACGSRLNLILYGFTTNPLAMAGAAEPRGRAPCIAEESGSADSRSV